MRGSFNYMYSKILDTYKGKLQDQELEEMLEDFCEVLSALERMRLNQTFEAEYEKAVNEFKQNWLVRNNRACYHVHATTPGVFPQHVTGYFDPTRRLLFTSFMTEDLAKHLGFKWWRD